MKSTTRSFVGRAVLSLALSACTRAEAPRGAAAPSESMDASSAAAGRTGGVRGVLRWSGPALEPEKKALPASVHRVCGQTVTALPVSMGTLSGVVVSMDLPAQASSPKILPAQVLDQVRCAYRPGVLAATLGSELIVQNSDALIHNVHGRQEAKTLFNFAMPLANTQAKKRFENAGVVEIGCDVHPWMRATVRVFEHPHFVLTGEEGTFLLEGIPAGRQKMSFWHPRLEPKTLEVDVPAGGTAMVEMEWNAVLPH
jgi:plastocyanin